ncbi:MAG: glycosyltransferase family 9 protein [candidate division WOR-3 bacterium]
MLIIKLDAMGDVLRTTCLLPPMAKAWPNSRVTWITRPESVPLLENNPYVTEVVPYGPDAVVHLLSRRFHKLINLDAGKVSSALAASARAEERIGYVLAQDGYVQPTSPEAETWLRMGIFDDLKKTNTQTYQEIMCTVLGLPTDGMRYVLELSDKELKDAQDHLISLGVDLEKSIIAIHTGAGGRWPQKQWGEGNLVLLINELIEELGDKTQVILFGGPSEENLNKRILESVSFQVFDAGCHNPVRHFAGLITCCSVVLSGDSLAMHVALATGRRVVVLFGPTSHAEIELFGLGEKVYADLDCLGCYRTQCTVSPNCMDLISVEMVKTALLRQLAIAIAQVPRSVMS